MGSDTVQSDKLLPEVQMNPVTIFRVEVENEGSKYLRNAGSHPLKYEMLRLRRQRLRVPCAAYMRRAQKFIIRGQRLQQVVVTFVIYCYSSLLFNKLCTYSFILVQPNDDLLGRNMLLG